MKWSRLDHRIFAWSMALLCALAPPSTFAQPGAAPPKASAAKPKAGNGSPKGTSPAAANDLRAAALDPGQPDRASAPEQERHLRVQWGGSPLRQLCGDRAVSQATKDALGCADLAKLGRLDAPLFALTVTAAPPQGQRTVGLCDQVADVLNQADRDTGLADSERDLLQACGYADNPLRALRPVCRRAAGLIEDRAAEEKTLENRPKRGGAEDPRLPAARAERKEIEAYAGALQCDAAKIPADLKREASHWQGPRSPVSPALEAILEKAAVGRSPAALEPEVTDLRRRNASLRAAFVGPVTAAAAAEFFLPLVQGLGDFLQARAKQELLAFAVNPVAKKFCKPEDAPDIKEIAARLRNAHLLAAADDPQPAAPGAKETEAWTMPIGDGRREARASRYAQPQDARQAAGTRPQSVAVGAWLFEVLKDADLKPDQPRTTARIRQAVLRLTGGQLFPETCSALFPEGLTGDAALDIIYAGRFQKVIAGELLLMPLRLIQLQDGIETADDVEQRQIRIILSNLAQGIQEAVAQKRDALAFVKGLADSIRADFQKSEYASVRPKCRYDGGKLGASCGMLFLLTTAATAAEVFPRDTSGRGFLDVATAGEAWLTRSSVAFCHDYGDPPGNGTDSKECLTGAVDPRIARAARAMIQAVIDFHNAVADVSVAYEAALQAGKPTFQAGAEAASGVAGAVDALVTTLVDSTEAILQATQGQADGVAQKLERTKQVIRLVDDVLKATTAATKHDYRAVAASLRIVFTSPLVADQLDPSFKNGMVLVLDVAEAKTREDVEKALEQDAAPLSTFRAKYQSQRPLLMLNGFVGFFAGGQIMVDKQSSHPSYRAPDPAWVAPLSAPVGLDLSISPFADNELHGGLTLTVIDPLALRLSETADKTTKADLSGVFAPGLLVRFGIARTPLVLMAGARIQPFLQSESLACGANGVEKACWQAPITFMGGLAIDVPIFQINKP